jgi:hypothetical protein
MKKSSSVRLSISLVVNILGLLSLAIPSVIANITLPQAEVVFDRRQINARWRSFKITPDYLYTNVTAIGGINYELRVNQDDYCFISAHKNSVLQIDYKEIESRMESRGSPQRILQIEKIRTDQTTVEHWRRSVGDSQINLCIREIITARRLKSSNNFWLAVGWVERT